MLDKLSKGLLGAAMVGVGAVALLAEAAVAAGKTCAEKGAAALEQGKVWNEELRRKGEQVSKERRERAASEVLERLNAEEREALRRRLDELDELEAAAREAAREAEAAQEAEAPQEESDPPCGEA